MKNYFIGIAGGTGSGKTTFTDRLKKRFTDSITIIYHDNYYKRNDDMPIEERRKLNYDHPDALETDFLAKHISELKSGKTINCPVYDFTQYNRSDETIEIKPNKIIIVEGILVLHSKALRDLFNLRIFIEADADERILRRVQRDVYERGRNLDNISKQYLLTVKPMHNQFVEPSKVFADIIINNAFNDVAFDVITTKIEKLLEG